MGSEHINALRVGAVVEEYRIERLLGTGGTAAVYLAHDPDEQPFWVQLFGTDPIAMADAAIVARGLDQRLGEELGRDDQEPRAETEREGSRCDVTRKFLPRKQSSSTFSTSPSSVRRSPPRSAGPSYRAPLTKNVGVFRTPRLSPCAGRSGATTR